MYKNYISYLSNNSDSDISELNFKSSRAYFDIVETVSSDIGKKYFGWQQQNHSSTNTIQYYVDKSLSKIADHKIKTICSGRTDTGVNALNQIVHFDTTSKRSDKNWIDGANSHLPDDIRVKRIYKVDNDFHARFLATRRTYKYFINTITL